MLLLTHIANTVLGRLVMHVIIYLFKNQQQLLQLERG